MPNTTPVTYPIVSIPFKGAYYMCVEGSKRADALQRANRAWTMGYDELSKDLFKEALESPGCAFEAREAAMADLDLGVKHNRDGYWSDTAAYYNLYN